MMDAKAKQALKTIIQRFKEGDIPEAIAHFLKSSPNWGGFLNKILFRPQLGIAHPLPACRTDGQLIFPFAVQFS